MDKYLVKTPYSYSKYGIKTGYVYANSEEEAFDQAYDNDLYDEDYEDDGESDSNDYDFENTEVILEESDVDEDTIPGRRVNYSSPSQYPYSFLPDYFLAEISIL